jgi:hypothetical protein
VSFDCYCDYEQPTFSSVTKPRARKLHRCEECGGKIKPGERYERSSGMWDGSISTFCTCERCHDIRVWLTNNLPCFCLAHGGMFEEAEESIREAQDRAPEEARGLLFGYYRRLILRDRYNAQQKAN